MALDLTDEEASTLVKHLRQVLDYIRYPFAPRTDPLRPILVKLEPPVPDRFCYSRYRLEQVPALGEGSADYEPL